MVKLDLNLLPEDRRFIEKILAGQPAWIVEAALKDYEITWRAAADNEPAPHKKDNAGRRAANTFFREIVWPSLLDNTSNAA